MGYYLIASVSLVILTTVVRIPSTQGTHHPDRFCVRNFGCDTGFQDMELGVSLFLVTMFCMKVIRIGWMVLQNKQNIKHTKEGADSTFFPWYEFHRHKEHIIWTDFV